MPLPDESRLPGARNPARPVYLSLGSFRGACHGPSGALEILCYELLSLLEQMPDVLLPSNIYFPCSP